MMRGSSFNDENLTAMKRIDSVSTTAATANNTITPNGNKLNNERNINVGQRTFYYRFNEFDVHDTK